MAEKVTIEKVLPEKAPGANGHGPRETPRDGATRARAAAGKAEPGRWVREAQGIVALGLAGFGFVALFSYDPRCIRSTSRARWGRSGSWLGWALFHGLRLRRLPLPGAAHALGVSRLHAARAWRTAGRPAAGSLSCWSARPASWPAPRTRWPSPAAQGRRGRLGGLRGAPASRRRRWARWIVLLALIPVGGLFVTQASVRRALARRCGAALRPAAAAGRAGRRRRREPGAGGPAAASPRCRRAAWPADRAGRAAAARREGAAARPSRGSPRRASPGRRPSTSARAARRRSSCPPVGLLNGAAGRVAPRTREELRGQRGDAQEEAPGLRGRRPHRAGEPGPGHHSLRVRAGGRASR